LRGETFGLDQEHLIDIFDFKVIIIAASEASSDTNLDDGFPVFYVAT
jgi:hypothetical protein